MKVNVVFRGGVGDLFVWMQKFQALLEFHKDAHVTFSLCSTWPRGVKTFVEHLQPRQFADVIILDPYDRPIPEQHVDSCFIGFDLVYHLDVWKGQRGDASRKAPLIPVERQFPHLECDPYPELDIPGDGVGGTVIQIEGRSIGSVCTPKWWTDGVKDYPPPVRLLGECEGRYADYGASSQIEDPVEVYGAIKSAKVMIGIDSGFRNIAFTTRTPVVEIRGTGNLGWPDYDVFVPEVYRDNMIFLNLVPPTLEKVLPKVTKLTPEVNGD